MFKWFLILLIVIGALGYYNNTHNNIDFNIPGFDKSSIETFFGQEKTIKTINSRRDTRNKEIEKIINGN